MSKSVVFSDKQLTFIRRPFDRVLEVNEGSPRSGKTLAGHFRYARYLIESKDTNHLVAGYNQEQAYRLFIEGDGTGLLHIFDGACAMKHNDDGDHLEIATPNGIKRVFYKGGGKANSVGSITGMSLGSVVFCEINLLHMDFIQECFNRTIASSLRYHLADLNPPSPQHPVIKEVFDVQDTKWTHWTMKDNPILTPEKIESIRVTLVKNNYLYKRNFLGERVMPQGVIYSNFDMDKNVSAMIKGEVVDAFYSADGGQGDATTCSFNLVTRVREDNKMKHRLYRVANYHHSGTETGEIKAMSDYAAEIKRFRKWCYRKFQYKASHFFVDPACKSLREELHKIGIATDKADNNSRDKASGTTSKIEIGIERFKSCISDGSFQLMEADEYDHYNFIKEVGLYVRGSNGRPVDANNHCLDEARYSVNYFYKTYINPLG